MAETEDFLFAILLAAGGLASLIIAVVQWRTANGDREIMRMTGGLGSFFVVLAVVLGTGLADIGAA